MIWGIAVWATLLSSAGAIGAVSPTATPNAAVARARLEIGKHSTPYCASRNDFAARIAARSPRIRFVEDPTAIGVQATFTLVRPGAVNAELTLVESGVSRPPRRFVAPSCAEAAEALALMVAVALDPVWVSQHRSPAPAKPDTAASASVATSLPGGAPDAASPTQWPSEPGRATAPQRNAAEPAAPSVSAATESRPAGLSRRHLSAHVGGQSVWGPSPTIMPGMAVVALGTLDREGLLSPALALGAFYVWSDNLDEPGGKASFSLVAGTFDACALHVQSSAVDVRVCAAMVVGRFSAVGSHTDAPASDAKLFAAAGASSVLRVQLGGAFELSARLGLGMTLRRSSYEFASTVFHTSARLTTSASLGVGVRLW